MREQHIKEIDRLNTAISKTKSEYLKNDYKKALIRMKKELKEYDKYKGGE